MSSFFLNKIKKVKWFTLVELIIVMVIMGILGTFVSNAYLYYMEQWRDEKRINIVRTYGIVLREVIWRYWDVPDRYCTIDGWLTYADEFSANSCFWPAKNTCFTANCTAANNYCASTGYKYFDFNKMMKDHSYVLPEELKFSWENMPDWFNFTICPRSGSDKAYIWNPIPKEIWYTGSWVEVENPSFMLKFIEDNGTNRIIFKNSDNL